MADNTIPITPGSGASVRTVTNAGVDSGAHQQVMSLADSAGNLIGTTGAPVPTSVVSAIDPDTVATGTITATDVVVAAPTGNGALLSGTPTASSFVSLAAPGGDSSWDLQVSGTFGGGTVYFEASFDGGTNWLPVNGRQTGVINTVLGYSTTAAGAFRGNTSGASNIRVRIVGATAPSVAVTLRISSGVGAVFLNASVPAGTNAIGTVGASSANVTGTMGVANATVDGTTDLSLYAQVRVSITGTYTGTVTFQVSDDATNWTSKQLISNATGLAGTNTFGVTSYYGDIGARFFRTNMTSYTSGTATATIQYTSAPASVGQVSSGSTGILSAAGGTGFFYVSTGTNAAQVIKTSATNLQTLLITNTAASTQYVKVFNATAVTLGTTAAAVDIPIAAAATLTLALGPNGQRMTTGLCLAITGASGATNNTANTAGVYIALTYI